MEGLTKQTGSERFAWDSYRRLLQMYGKTVMGVDGDRFEEALEHAKEAKGVRNDVELDAGDLRELVEEFKGIVATDTGHEFPQDPTEQLTGGIEAVFGSWDNKRAVDYRRKNKIDDSLGTAVNIQAMVFGNKGDDSGTGVAFTATRPTASPPLRRLPGQRPGRGRGRRHPQHHAAGGDGRGQSRAWEELQGHMQTLEGHYRDMCDIEFTVEQGKLWLLQTRIGKRTAFAEWIMAHDMHDEGLIDIDTAMLRLDANRLEELFKKVIAEGGGPPRSPGPERLPGAAVGKAVFSADDAQAWATRGEPVILVRRETTPDDYHGMIRSEGILTSAGGTNSHAAVVAQARASRPCAAPTRSGSTARARKFTAGGTDRGRGDWVTIDGFTGKVYAGSWSWPTRRSSGPARATPRPARRRSGRPTSASWPGPTRSAAQGAGQCRHPGQSANAIERGAEGIGLCRTEHMFLGEERVAAVRTMIFADSEAEQAAYDTLLPLQRDDFVGIFQAMDGKPVTVRLLDPPLHEFLPDQVDLAVAVALAKEQGRTTVEVGSDEAALDQADRDAGQGQRPARGQPDAGAARGAPGDPQAGPVRHAGPGHHRGRGQGQGRRRQPDRGDHDPAGRDPRGAVPAARGAGAGGPPDPGRPGPGARGAVGDDDRAAPGGPGRGRDRRGGRVLLLRHQRPHPDRVRVLRDDIGKFLGMYEERKLSRPTRS